MYVFMFIHYVQRSIVHEKGLKMKTLKESPVCTHTKTKTAATTTTSSIFIKFNANQRRNTQKIKKKERKTKPMRVRMKMKKIHKNKVYRTAATCKSWG